MFHDNIIILYFGSRTIAVHLFDRLGDEELTNRVEASALFAKLGTMFLPILAKFMCIIFSNILIGINSQSVFD